MWEMGLLEPGDWRAKWIDFPAAQGAMPTTTRSTGKNLFTPNFPPYLRKTFDVAKPVKRARLYATALGLYQCWMNGRQAGDAVLAPDWTNYHHRVRYQTFDVTDSLRHGQNVIGAVLGDGWYSGNICWIGGHVYGSRPALLAQLVIDYVDGSRDIVGSDETWRATTGPIRHSDFQDGEEYDARLEIPGWNSVGFNDSSWKPVSARQEKPALEAQIGPAVRRTHEITAKKVTEAGAGKYVFDFGQNMVGFARLSAEAPAGTKVTIRFAEMLNPDGTIYTENLRTARQTDSYVFKGMGKEVWEPSFTFHGFRFAEVSGFPGKIQPEMLTGIVIGSDNAQSGSFECSNPMLNQLYSNIVWGQRGNFVSIPTDCPQRDERLGWMADAQVFWRTASYNMDLATFSRKFAGDMRGTQAGTPYYGIYAPGTATKSSSSGAGWSDAGVIIPWTSWLQSGDTSVIEQNWAAMEKYLDAIDAANPDGLWKKESGIPFGDWLSPEGRTEQALVATAYWAYDVTIMREMALATGRAEDAEKYARLFEKIRTAFDKQFVRDDGFVAGVDKGASLFGERTKTASSGKGDTQTGYVLALHMNLLPEALRTAAAQKLADKIEANHGLLSTGFLGTPYLLEELTKAGHAKLAYKLLLNTEYPSWGYLVGHGATTMWERWNGDQMKDDPSMNSYNHYAYGAVADWIYRYAAGVDASPLDAGFHTVALHPVFDARMGWVRFDYASAYGAIHSDWKVNGMTAEWHLTIPANTTGWLPLNANEAAKYKLDGVTLPASKLAKTLTRDGESGFELGAGSYTFAVEM